MVDQLGRRASQRHKVLKDGKIIRINNWSMIDFCFRDVSEAGARIRCAGPAVVPAEFRLLIPHDQTIRDAEVVWRREDQCGIRFTGPPRRAPPRKW